MTATEEPQLPCEQPKQLVCYLDRQGRENSIPGMAVMLEEKAAQNIPERREKGRLNCRQIGQVKH